MACKCHSSTLDPSNILANHLIKQCSVLHQLMDCLTLTTKENTAIKLKHKKLSNFEKGERRIQKEQTQENSPDCLNYNLGF